MRECQDFGNYYCGSMYETPAAMLCPEPIAMHKEAV